MAENEEEVRIEFEGPDGEVITTFDVPNSTFEWIQGQAENSGLSLEEFLVQKISEAADKVVKEHKEKEDSADRQ